MEIPNKIIVGDGMDRGFELPKVDLPKNDSADFNDLFYDFEAGENVTTSELIKDQKTKIEEYYERKIEAYDNSDLPEIVGDLKKELANCKPNKHPSYLNKGGESMVFSIRDSDDEHLVVRLPNPTPMYDRQFDIDEYLEGFALGEGNEVLEQPRAASPYDQAIVSPFINGERINELSTSYIKRLDAGQVARFADGVCEAYDEQGVEFDIVGGNFLYHPETGIIAIDYCGQDYYSQDSSSSALSQVLETMLGSCVSYKRLSGKKQNEIIRTLHEGVEASERLTYKTRVHRTIDNHKPY